MEHTTTRETVHITPSLFTSVTTHCGHLWTQNMIGVCEVRQVHEFIGRADIRICPDCIGIAAMKLNDSNTDSPIGQRNVIQFLDALSAVA